MRGKGGNGGIKKETELGTRGEGGKGGMEGGLPAAVASCCPPLQLPPPPYSVVENSSFS